MYGEMKKKSETIRKPSCAMWPIHLGHRENAPGNRREWDVVVMVTHRWREGGYEQTTGFKSFQTPDEKMSRAFGVSLAQSPSNQCIGSSRTHKTSRQVLHRAMSKQFSSVVSHPVTLLFFSFSSSRPVSRAMASLFSLSLHLIIPRVPQWP